MELNLEEINSIDVRQLRQLASKYIKRKKTERLLRKLDMSEAFFMAYVGAQPVPRGKPNINNHKFQAWQRKLVREINRDYNGKSNSLTLADKIKMARKAKKRGKLKF